MPPLLPISEPVLSSTTRASIHPSGKVTLRRKAHVATVCLSVQMFQRCVASVSHQCCKSRSGCCNGYTRMLQACVPNVLSIFQKHVVSVFILVLLFGCCICFAMAFQVFFQMFLQMFQTHFSNVSFVFGHMLQIFHLYVLKVDRSVVEQPRASRRKRPSKHPGISHAENIMFFNKKVMKN